MNIQPGTGSGGCASPSIPEGRMVYNTDQRLLQGCAGNVHRPFGETGGGGDWIQISTGPSGDHTCAIRPDFTLWCWGNNTNG